MNKEEIFEIAAAYKALLTFIVRMAAKKDPDFENFKVRSIEYFEPGIRVVLHMPGFKTAPETIIFTYEELELT